MPVQTRVRRAFFSVVLLGSGVVFPLAGCSVVLSGTYDASGSAARDDAAAGRPHGRADAGADDSSTVQDAGDAADWSAAADGPDDAGAMDESDAADLPNGADGSDGEPDAAPLQQDCSSDHCAAVCGDGIHDVSEGCDDGNLQSGDGCSSTCVVEPGFSCTDTVEAPAPTRDLPVVYRDFMANASLGGHPDFMNLTIDANGLPMFQDPAIDVVAQGLVKTELDADGRPQFLSSTGSGALPIIQSANSFYSWFRDTSYSKKVVSSLALAQVPGGGYEFTSTSFYPLDGVPGSWPEQEQGNDGTMHNFLFTSEIHLPFQFRGGENITIRGDDDTWVFLNGRLVLDLGGVKSPRETYVPLRAADGSGLTYFDRYEVVIFHAERQPPVSNVRIFISGFDRVSSGCVRN